MIVTFNADEAVPIIVIHCTLHQTYTMLFINFKLLMSANKSGDEQSW